MTSIPNGKVTTKSDDTGRNIILCFDGTTQNFGNKNSNIVKLYSMFDKSNPSKQVCYYQPGIGQYFEAGVISPLVGGIAQVLDWAFAWYMYQHIIDGYQFIVDNWSDGDHIYIFGFSRGAYVARCVAGMVKKIGLITKGNGQVLSLAYDLYARTDEEGIELAGDFKKSFARDIKVDFVGVFDTVSSVGLVIQRELPDTASNTGIATFRQAFALDEHRFRFGPTPFDGPLPFPKEDGLTSHPYQIPDFLRHAIYKTYWRFKHLTDLSGYYRDEGNNFRSAINKNLDSIGAFPGVLTKEVLKMSEDPKAAKTPLPKPDVKEVCFVGCHEDIGGGVESSKTPNLLSNVALRWMVGELMFTNPRIVWIDEELDDKFGEEVIRDYKANPSPKKPIRAEEKDNVDVLEPLHDDLSWQAFIKVILAFDLFRLVQLAMYFVMELSPLGWSWQDHENGGWYRQLRVNFWRGRTLPASAKYHKSVKIRMDSKELVYTPLTEPELAKIVWEDDD